MRLALRQRLLEQPGRRRSAASLQRLVEQPRAEQLHGLGAEMAEMLGQPRLPHQLQPVARLQHRPRPPPAAALDQPQMAAVLEGQRRQDRIGLAVRPHGQRDPFVLPVHP